VVALEKRSTRIDRQPGSFGNRKVPVIYDFTTAVNVYRAIIYDGDVAIIDKSAARIQGKGRIVVRGPRERGVGD